MTLDPLLSAPLAVQIHVFTVAPASLIGGWMLMARKGTRLHKMLGRLWLFLMAVTAVSSFFIHEIRLLGPYSPIHLLSVVTLISCFIVVWSARTKRLAIHKRTVQGLYFGAIGLAGLFTLLPGRIMHQVVFGPGAPLSFSWMFGLFGAAVVAFVIWRSGPRTGQERGSIL